MFLGINEMKYQKGRYFLILSVIVLIAWLVFILNGLAEGLAQGNRMAIDKWDATGIIVSEEANDSLNASTLSASDKDKIHADKVEEIGQLTIAIKQNKNSERENVSMFGINQTGFLTPKVIEGKTFTQKNEIIASETLKNKGFKLGDSIEAGTYKDKLKIVGWTSESSYNIIPVVYTSVDTWRTIKFGDMADKQINGFVVKSDKQVKTDVTDSSYLKIEDFIQKLPGYQAQNLTLDGMVYFLMFISSFIIGIFIFVMTLQKSSMFGVLKVQGVPTSFLARSVIGQTSILAVMGVGIGGLLTALTVLILPDSMPFYANVPQLIMYGVLLMFVAILGSVFSVRTIAKVDPLIAIGG